MQPQSQPVGQAERDAAVQRLRTNLDEGRLSQDLFDQRVGTALAAADQQELDALFLDLPQVATAGSFELYPHQQVSVYQPAVDPNAPDPTRPEPYQQTNQQAQGQGASFKLFGMEFNNVPSWVWPLMAVAMIVAMFGLFRWGMWWLIFFIPGIWGWGGSHQRRRERRQQWQQQREQWRNQQRGRGPTA